MEPGNTAHPGRARRRNDRGVDRRRSRSHDGVRRERGLRHRYPKSAGGGEVRAVSPDDSGARASRGRAWSSGRRTKEPPAEPGGPVLEKLALPFAINAEQVTVRDLELRNSTERRIFALDNAGWRRRHEEISLTRLKLDSAAGELAGQLRLGLAPPASGKRRPRCDVFDAAKYCPRSPSGSQPMSRGSLAELQINVSSVEPSLEIAGNLFDLTGHPGWEVRVRAPYLQWPLAPNAATNAGEPPQVSLREVDLETSGDLSGYRIDGHRPALDRGHRGTAICTRHGRQSRWARRDPARFAGRDGRGEGHWRSSMERRPGHRGKRRRGAIRCRRPDSEVAIEKPAIWYSGRCVEPREGRTERGAAARSGCHYDRRCDR